MIERAHSFDRRFFVGLYLLIRQIQLSIDRVKPSQLRDFTDYFSTRGVTEHSLARLEGALNVRPSQLEEVKRLSVPRLGFLEKVFAKKHSLYASEVLHLLSSLKQFQSVLERKSWASSVDLLELRQQLVQFETRMESRVSGFESTFRNVEHFNQGTPVPCKSIKEIVGEGWDDLG